MTGNRNIGLDIAKGFGILLVIIGHIPNMRHICMELIYCFHMPLFFLIAGYLYHRQDIKDLSKKSARRLLLPFAITLLIMIAICLVCGKWDDALGFAQGFIFPDGSRWDNMLWPGIHSSGSIWFLPALFWCRMIYAIIEQRLGEKSYTLTIPVTIVAVLLGRFVLNLPLAIQVGCSALIFYEIGYRANQWRMFERNIPWWIYVLFVPMWVFYERYVTFEMFWYKYELTYPIDVMVACMVTFLMIKICQKLANVVELSAVGGASRGLALILSTFYASMPSLCWCWDMLMPHFYCQGGVSRWSTCVYRYCLHSCMLNQKRNYAYVKYYHTGL